MEDYKIFDEKLSKDDIEIELECYNDIINSDKLKPFTKKVLAALLFIWDNTKARQTGVMYMDVHTIRRVAGVKLANMYSAFKQLENYGILDYSKGKKRTEGNKAEASSFIINFEALCNSLEIKEGSAQHYTTLYNTIPNYTIHNNTKQNFTEQNNTKQNFTEQNRTELNHTKPNCSELNNKNDTPVKSKDKLSDSSLFLQFRKQIENPSYDKLIKDITDTNFKRMVINKFYNFIKKNDELFKNKTELNSVKSYLFKIIKDKNKTRQSQLFYENCIQLGKELFDRLDREFNNRESYGKITEGKNNQWSASDTTSSYVKPYGEIPNNALVIEEPCCVAVPISSQVII